MLEANARARVRCWGTKFPSLSRTPGAGLASLVSLQYQLAVTGAGGSGATSLLLDGYQAFNLTANATLQHGAVAGGLSLAAFNFSTAAGSCGLEVVSVSGSSTSAATMALSAASSGVRYAIGTDGSLPPLTPSLEGAPGAVAALRVSCTLWGKAATSGRVAFQLSPFLASEQAPVSPYGGGGASVAAPSGSDAASAFNLSRPLVIAVPLPLATSCSVAVANASCPAAGFAGYGVGYVAASSRGAVVAVVAGADGATGDAASTTWLGAPPPGTALVVLRDVAVTAPSGCAVQLRARCRDVAGRENSTVLAPLSATGAAWTSVVAVPRLRGEWSAETVARVNGSVVAPESLALGLRFRVGAPPSAASQVGALPSVATPARWWSCTAMLLDAGVAVPTSTALSEQRRFALDGVSPSAMVDVYGGGGGGSDGGGWSVNGTFPAVDASFATLSQSLAVHAECEWTPTGERVRLSPLVVCVVTLSVSLVAQQHGGAAPTPIVAGSVSVLASVAVNVSAVLTVAWPAPGGAAAIVSSSALPAASCQWVVVNATSRRMQQVAAPWSVGASGAGGAAAAGAGISPHLPVPLQAEGPPGGSLTVRLRCELPEPLEFAPDLQVLVFDWDLGTKDDLLGRFFVPVHKLKESMPIRPTWYARLIGVIREYFWIFTE